MQLDKNEKRGIIYYNWKKGLNVEESFNDISKTFGYQLVSESTIRRWNKEFNRERASLKDEIRGGRIPSVVTTENIEKVRSLIIENPKVSCRDIMEDVGIGASSTQKILHEHLLVRKIFTKWVPHFLTSAQKKERLNLCKKNLKILKDGGYRVWSKIVTGDETSVPIFSIPTRQESAQWVFEDEDPPTQCKSQNSRKKLIFTTFFRSTGLVLNLRLEGQKTVTSKYFTEVCLPKMLDKIQIKGLILHYDNASSHTAGGTQKFITDNKITLMQHPPYSPDLAPCDFWLFPKLKKALRGTKFETPEEIEDFINEFYATISLEEWRGVYEMWMKRMKKCIKVHGEYFEHL